MTAPFRALVFGPGLPVTGTPAVLAIQGDALTVTPQGADHPLTLSPSTLRLREVGFGRGGIELAWHAPDGDWLVHVLDPDEATRLQGLAQRSGLSGMAALQATVKTRRRRRAVGWTSLAILGLSPLLAVIVLYFNADRIAAWAIQSVPEDTEARFGRSAFEALRGRLSLRDEGPEIDRVRTLGKRLTQGSPHRYQFHVAEDATVNAFALPGGIVVVNTGLLQAMQRPEELAGVLGHEIEHVEQRHSLQALAKDWGWRAAWALIAGEWGGTLAADAATQLGSLKFSRDAERQADAGGFDRLVAAGIDPSGMRDFFRRLAADGGFLSTHPSGAEREQQMDQRMQRLGSRHFEPLAGP